MTKPNLIRTLARISATVKDFVARRWDWIVLAIILALVILTLLYAGYWATWTGFGGYRDAKGEWQREKTLWDWLDLLIIPLVLAGGATLFTWVTNRREQAADERRAQVERDAEERHIQEAHRVEEDRFREAALQAYLDGLAELIEKGLCESQEDDAKRSIARARTLTVLRQLDSKRKGLLVGFLYDSALIGTMEKERKSKPMVVPLDDADLSTADLSGAYLPGAFLHWTNLSQAILIEASLDEAFLMGTDLTGANLELADLSGANLESAILKQSSLKGSTMRRVILKDAEVQPQQLAQSKVLEAATLPDGTKFTSDDPADVLETTWAKAQAAEAKAKAESPSDPSQAATDQQSESGQAADEPG